MKSENLEEFFNQLLKVHGDLRAEVFIAEIQGNFELPDEDFLIANQSTFSRGYSRDIIDTDGHINKNKLTLNLSRNGLYDILPEGLFHTQAISKDTNSYVARRKTVKQEEQDARLLFAPLENEFFYQKLNIERNERTLLDDFFNLNDNFLLNFWKIDQGIPEDYTLQLIKLLPHSHKIVGDFELTRLSLEKVLNEKVTFIKKNIILKNEGIDHGIGTQLGVDTVLESDTNEVMMPALEVTIGPISMNGINTFLNETEVLNFIYAFYDYFIPLEMEVITKLIVNKNSKFLLGDTNNTILGISTQL
ncbi:hypothetical protein [Eudoraea adriatica]|uniref:hypothetical protein n=1 Tax=Eudoraea adriatica TaxID=446681 RepID=UPI00036F5925|nr:hypothetical protein [Eudoraea adriatica]